MKKLSGVWWTPFEVSRASMNGDNGWYYKHEVTHDMKSLQLFYDALSGPKGMMTASLSSSETVALSKRAAINKTAKE